MDKITIKYERKGDKQFHKDFECSFDYDPDRGIGDILRGFKTFLYGLTYLPSTIKQHIRDVDEDDFDDDDEVKYILTDEGRDYLKELENNSNDDFDEMRAGVDRNGNPIRFDLFSKVDGNE